MGFKDNLLNEYYNDYTWTMVLLEVIPIIICGGACIPIF
jgi:hypothetical protein